MELSAAVKHYTFQWLVVQIRERTPWDRIESELRAKLCDYSSTWEELILRIQD